MKKKTQKLAAGILSAMAVSSLTLPVHAANYTPVNGTETTFDKYLIIDQDANVPAAEFSFTITPGTAAAATQSSMEVLAGVTSATGPSITNTAVFTPSDTAFNVIQTGDSLTLGQNEKYAVKTLTVDFSGVAFDEPGIYRYIVSETALAEPGAFTQDDTSKILDVYVTDASGTLNVASYVLHTSDAAPVRNNTGGSADVAEALANVSDKVTGFINRYSTKDLTITKQVAGNQASRDKYFQYTLNISGAGNGTKIAVDVTENAETAPLANSATSYTAADMGQANNITELTCQADGSLTHVFYLKHGQSISLKGLPAGASYELREAAEDYVSADLHSVDENTYSAASGTIAESDVTIGFRNTRDGVIPTGVILSITPYALMVLVATAGMVMLGRRSMIH